MSTSVIPPRWDPSKRKTSVFGANGRLNRFGGNSVRIVGMGGMMAVRGATIQTKPEVKKAEPPPTPPPPKPEEKPVEKPTVEAEKVIAEAERAAVAPLTGTGWTGESEETDKPTETAEDPWAGSGMSEEQKEDANAIEPPIDEPEPIAEETGEEPPLQGELNFPEQRRHGKRGRRKGKRNR